MLDHSIALENSVQSRERTPAIDHEVFRYDFEPVHARLLFEDMSVVRNSESDSDSVVREPVKPICRHDVGKRVEPAQNTSDSTPGVPLALLGAVGRAATLALTRVFAF